MFGQESHSRSRFTPQHIVKFTGNFLLCLIINPRNTVYSLRNADHQLVSPVSIPIHQIHNLIVWPTINVHVRRILYFYLSRVLSPEIDLQILILCPKLYGLPLLTIQRVNSRFVHLHFKFICPIVFYFARIDNRLVESLPLNNLHIESVIRKLHFSFDRDRFLSKNTTCTN